MVTKIPLFGSAPVALLFVLVSVSCQRPALTALTHPAKSLDTVKNLRPVVAGGSIFRAATLDFLSESDARNLLDGSALGGGIGGTGTAYRPLAAVIDLRNRDEIRKGEKERTEGAKLFYSSLTDGADDIGGGEGRNSAPPRLIHVPVLGDVDAFWDEAINRMDGPSRAAATLQTAFSGGALDRAAARNLEAGGHALLYTVMLATAGRPLLQALEVCARESARGDGGAVVFHCQKGKDRTGVLSMLIQSCVGDSEDDILDAYGQSGDLLGGEDSSVARDAWRDDDQGASSKSSSGGTVDWSHFRGSPPSAMADTLEWIRQRYGSVDAYLDSISFGEEKRGIFG